MLAEELARRLGRNLEQELDDVPAFVDLDFVWFK